MNNIFITQIVPKNKIKELHVSQAACNFSYSLIDTKCFDFTASLIPINVDEKVNFVEKDIFKVQCRFFPHRGIFRALNMLIESISLTYIAKNYAHVWFYNITVHTLLSFIILKYFFRKNVYVIVADYTPTLKKYSIQRLVKKVIESSSGLILLSSRSEFKHNNFFIIPGIKQLSAIRTDIDTINQKGKRKFLFSGVLGEVTGLPMALEVFKNLEDVDLFITGRADLTLFENFKDYSNIHYLGFLSYEEYLVLLKDMDICINFRNPNLPENNNNFPSKILEYFSFNKVVVSTILYPELNKFSYFCEKYDKELLMKKIREINNMDEDLLLKYCNHATLLMNNFSENAWKNAIEKIQLNSN
jgi:glycosyltransferase involved in cell wall biosynthesis